MRESPSWIEIECPTLYDNMVNKFISCPHTDQLVEAIQGYGQKVRALRYLAYIREKEYHSLLRMPAIVVAGIKMKHV